VSSSREPNTILQASEEPISRAITEHPANQQPCTKESKSAISGDYLSQGKGQVLKSGVPFTIISCLTSEVLAYIDLQPVHANKFSRGGFGPLEWLPRPEVNVSHVTTK